jgi:hypothetical protein
MWKLLANVGRRVTVMQQHDLAQTNGIMQCVWMARNQCVLTASNTAA